MTIAAKPRPGHQSLRHGRVSLARHCYHLTMTTLERAAVFAAFGPARTVARTLNDPRLLGDASTLCWVVMPDHVHWLVQLGENRKLGDLVRRFKSASARDINLSIGRAGSPLWSRAYHDHGLRSDEDLETIARYIVANPMRARLVDSIAQYPHWDAAWEWEW